MGKDNTNIPINEDEEPECDTWHVPNNDVESPLLSSPNAENQYGEMDRKGFFLSLITLLGSIPALIGAWCWPALVIGILGGAVTAGARQTGHYISFGLTLGMMLAVNGYMLYCAITKRAHEKKHRYTPLILTSIAAVLIMADLSRHVLQDLNWWKSGPFPGSSEYNENCHREFFYCLSPVGWIVTIGCTYIGFLLLFWGTMWNAHLLDKLRDVKRRWRELRQQY